MERRRVAITGMGVVSAVGHDLDSLWAALCADTDGPVPTELIGFDPESYMHHRVARRADPVMQYAVAASVLARRSAGDPPLDRDRTGCILGVGYGSLTDLHRNHELLVAEGHSAVSPILAVTICGNAAAAAVAQHFEIGGPTNVVGGACASSTLAIGDAARLIAHGEADVVFTGGAEGPVSPVVRAAYENLRTLSQNGWERPFDRRRQGFVMSSGAAVLMLEPLDSALERGATVLAEVAGWANTNDGASPVHPTGDGARRCMQRAVACAGLDPSDIAHVNAHGTGTQTNDPVESAAILAAIGAQPAVTSVKGRLGHLIGASGAIEAVASVLALQHRLLPPTASVLELDPEIGVDVVHGAPRPWEPGPTLSNSFGLGGSNGSIVLLPPGWR